MRTVDSIDLYITTNCNLKCKYCCTQTQDKWNISLEELKDFIDNVGELNELVITGGEPSIHKDFPKIVTELKTKVKKKKFILASNGFMLHKIDDKYLEMFDEIRISIYPENDNDELLKWIDNMRLNNTKIITSNITMIDEITDSSCRRGESRMVSHIKGNIYGCCVSAGIKDSDCAPFTKNWRKDVLKLALPCEKCYFKF